MKRWFDILFSFHFRYICTHQLTLNSLKGKGMTHKYYAFISYSRADEEWAKWLQHEFEHYRLPATLNGRTDLPTEFRPIFRDVDELSAGNLPTQIFNALSQSRFLVVICSPHAAKSQWVNKEIADFIEIGRQKGIDHVANIFPFIVEGTPHSSGIDECFPEILRNMKAQDERIGGNIQESGRDKAFVKTLAGTLQIGFDTLWNRYEKEKIEEEQRKREERDKLLITQSRFLSEKAKELIDQGNTNRAALLLLEALPQNISDPDDRPLIPEAEFLLRKAVEYKSIVFDGRIIPGSRVLSQQARTVVTFRDDTILLWHVDTGECSCLDFEYGIKNAAFSPSGNYFAGFTDNRIAVWDFHTRQLIASQTLDNGYSLSSKIDFLEDEKLISLEDEVNNGYVYDTTTNSVYWDRDRQWTPLRSNQAELCNKEQMQFSTVSPSGRYVATLDQRQIKLFDLEQNSCIFYVDDEFSPSCIAAFCHPANAIVYINGANELKWCNWDSGETKAIDYTPQFPVRAFAYLPSSNELVLLGNHMLSVIPLNLSSIRELPRLKLHQPRFVPHTRYLAAIVEENTGKYLYKTELWDMDKSKDAVQSETYRHTILPQRFISESHFAIKSFNFSSDASLLVELRADNSITVYQGSDGSCVGQIKAFKERVVSASFSPCNRYIIATSEDNDITIWGLHPLTLLHTIHTVTPIRNAMCSADGKWILSTHEHEIGLYAWDGLKCIGRIKAPLLQEARFSACGQYILAALKNGVKVYRLSGEEVNQIRFNKRVAYSNECSYIDELYGFSPIYGSDLLILNYESSCYIGNLHQKKVEKIDGPVSNITSITTCGEYLLCDNRLFVRADGGVLSPPSHRHGHQGESESGMSSITFPNGTSYLWVGYIDANASQIFRQAIRQIRVSAENCIYGKNTHHSDLEGGVIYHIDTDVWTDSAWPAHGQPDAFGSIRILNDTFELLFEESPNLCNGGDRSNLTVIERKSRKPVCTYKSHTPEETIVDATFSPNGDAVIFITDRFLYIKPFVALQYCIDETYRRFQGSQLTKEERARYYLE